MGNILTALRSHRQTRQTRKNHSLKKNSHPLPSVVVVQQQAPEAQAPAPSQLSVCVQALPSSQGPVLFV